MSYYSTPYQKRLERRLLPWFLAGTLLMTHAVLSCSERAIEVPRGGSHWSSLEMPPPLPPLPR